MRTGWLFPIDRNLASALACLAGFAAALTPGAVSSAPCQGRIGPETNLTGKTAYDPFSPTGIADEYRISVRNIGEVPCTFALLFRSRSPNPRLGGVLAYELGGSDAPSLLTEGPPPMAPVARLRTPVAVTGAASVDVRLVIPRGQPAPPGAYRDTVELELYAFDDSGRAAGPALDRAGLTIAYTVARVLSVNIKGADTTATLSFGALAKGQQRSVEIQARSNQPYQLEIASDRGGALVLTPAVPGESWSVPYQAVFAGQRLELARPARLGNLPATRPEADASYPLTVTIGEVGQKRAGRYEDVITIEIKGAIP